MGARTIHKTDIKFNKDSVDEILKEIGMNYADLYKKMKDSYGLDMEYKSFMNLISNRVTWKLLYAWALVDVLEIDLRKAFKVIEVDVDKVKEQKDKWDEKYGKKRG